MLYLSRPTRPHRTPFAGRVLASVLLLLLLAGAIPFSSLASSHECTMSCCLGKPAHLAGSCSTALDDEEEAETPAVEEGDEEAAAVAQHHDHMMHERSATSGATPSTEAAKHQEPATQRSAHHSTQGKKSPGASSVTSQAAMTTPCSAECAAAAAVYSQVRRPRDPASLSIAARPRPPTRQFIFSHFSKPLTEATARRKLTRPRAPPFISR